MQVVYEKCCGVDIHKKLVVACLLVLDQTGKRHKQIRSFSTMTEELLELLDWLKAEGCTHLAMESTGVFWKPLYNLLEGQLEVWVVNAAHMKAVPGRKTDCKDAEWLAELLQHGLLKASFIPPAPQRHLRDLTRYRSALVADRAQLINRFQKLLEDANVKLAAVATDITGVSGRSILTAMAEGEAEVDVLVELAKGRLRNKMVELKQALSGRVQEHHRFMLRRLLEQLEFYDRELEEFNQEIERRLGLSKLVEPNSATAPHALNRLEAGKVEAEELARAGQIQTRNRRKVKEPSGANSLYKPNTPTEWPSQSGKVLSEIEQALAWLDSIPGVNQRIGEIILAEIGRDMTRFPSAGHLANWVGLCPGHNESGGKRRSGKTTKGSRWLRQALIEAAQAAMHTRDTYLAAQGRRLTARLGRKKAAVAVAHSIVVIVYYLLKRGEYYKELGGDYFSKLDQEAIKRRALRQLESLGYKVELAKAG